MKLDKKQLRLNMTFPEALQRFARVETKELIEPEETGNVAAPFVKWVGGKRGIISELVARVPETFGEYWEPFVGGGALFFELYGRITQAHLSDMNFDLIIAYEVVKKHPEELIKALQEHAKRHDEDYYYKVRARHNLQDPIEIAARILYLNRTCYNGLWRTNKKGEFNVPCGRYANPDVVRSSQLRACSKALKKAEVKYLDFAKIEAKAGDFVYFDPPYHPTNETSFTTYTKGDFTEKDQERLRDFVLELHKRGVKVMLSNSDTPFIRALYKNKIFKVGFVSAPRNVNCKADKRNPAQEVLITNY